MRIITPILISIALSACGLGKADDIAEPVQATEGERQRYDAAADRALTFLDGTGFVVTRRGDEEKHHGDSLLFTGLLVASLPCDKGARPAQALFEMPPEFWRHRILAGQPVSLDQALGAYLAIAYRIVKCGEREKWAPFLALHRDIGGPDVPPYFDYVRDRLFSVAGVGDAPDSRRAELEFEVGGWMFTIETARKAWKAAPWLVEEPPACYRANLGLLSFEILELLGEEVGGGAFCANTVHFGLPTVDHWCGRDGLKSFIDGYKFNEWQYRSQRCTEWEEPDGNGDEQPGIDLLRALATYYRF